MGCCALRLAESESRVTALRPTGFMDPVEWGFFCFFYDDGTLSGAAPTEA